jgi:hypothetical protein
MVEVYSFTMNLFYHMVEWHLHNNNKKMEKSYIMKLNTVIMAFVIKNIKYITLTSVKTWTYVIKVEFYLYQSDIDKTNIDLTNGMYIEWKKKHYVFGFVTSLLTYS